MTTILFSLAVLGGIALLLGLGLGYAGKRFHVEEDPRIGQIREALPGANCGGCGFAGCDALASAIVDGSAKPTGCPVASGEATAAISAIMGVSAEETDKMVSYVHCCGDLENSKSNYEYQGLDNCMAMMQLAGGGSKVCKYGCLGGGSCVAACKFDAISLVNGIAVIDNEKCTGCNMCVAACPKSIISDLPYKATVRVACNSCDNGKTVRGACSVGCIACKMCEKACEFDAIHVNNFLAEIDYSKCTLCGKCAQKCPTKVIKVRS